MLTADATARALHRRGRAQRAWFQARCRLQFTPQIFGFAQTTVATIGIKDSGDSSILDEVSLLVGAFYSVSNKLDLGAAISIPESDDIGFVFTLRLFF